MAGIDSIVRNASKEVEATKEKETPNNSTETKTEATVETPTTEAPATTPIQEEKLPDELLSVLKEKGIKSAADLDAIINREPPKQKTPDEEESEFLAYGTKEGKLKLDDFVNAKKLKDTPDKDLVYQEFAEKLRKKDKNLTDEIIQEKFDRKYGDEQDGSVVYDEDEISERASQLRQKKWEPIEKVRQEYTGYVQTEKQRRETENFLKQVDKEFGEFASKIGDSISIKIDDKDSIPYELTPEYKQQLIPRLQEQYKFLRSQNPDGKFDFNMLLEHAVKTDNFGNIINIVSNQRSDGKVREALKPFGNPIEQTNKLPLNEQPVDRKAETKKAVDGLPKVR